MNLLLAITESDYTSKIIETKSFGEVLGFGAQMLGIGLLAVFSVLCLLWGALTLFKTFFYDLPGKKTATAPAKEVQAPVEAPAPIAVASEDEELVAVIAAAIAMAESESLGAKFRVVSFKRK